MPNLFGTPVLAPGADGRLELFAFAVDSNLWHIYQTAPSNGWTGWSSYGGSFGGFSYPPGMATNQDGRLEVFVSSGGGLSHMWQATPTGGWTTWAGLAAPLTAASALSPADVVRDAAGRLRAYVTDGAQLWSIMQTAPNGGWTGWTGEGSPSGLTLPGPPHVTRNAQGRLELFVVASNGELWNRSEGSGGALGSWQSMGIAGNGFDDRPAAVPSADGRLELFVRARDNALWHRWQLPGGGWSGWTSHGNAGVGLWDHPVLAPSADGRLELFMTGLDGNLWHMWQTAVNNGWSPWFSHGNPGVGLGPAPVLAASADGRLELFVIGGGALHHLWQTSPSNGWTGWHAHGHP